MKNKEEFTYQQHTKIIKEEVFVKNDNQIISEKNEIKEKEILIFKYKDETNEYNLKGKKVLFSFTNLDPYNIYDVININDKYYYVYTNKNSELIITDNLKNLIKFKSKCLKISIKNNKINFWILGFLISKISNLKNYNIDFCFKIGNKFIKKCECLEIYSKKPNKIKKILNLKNYYKMNINLQDIISDEENVYVNNALCLSITFNGVEMLYPVKMRKKVKKKKYNYLPLLSKKVNEHYVVVRKSVKQNVMIVKRELEDIEKDSRFQFYESKIMTLFFKLIGTIYKIIIRKKINLYFEKFASKAEEGTFELFEIARDHSKISKNYYIIEDTEENKKYLQEKNVCAKFSFKYYLLIFASSAIISTEAPAHLNLLRTINASIKKSIYDKKFIFLQHGIIFLKNLGKNSTFSKGKDAYPDLFVVSSKKEAKVVNDMLKIPKERLIITGLAILDKVKYNHINSRSKNTVVIMLTWKPYEEQLSDFTKSTYYKYTLNLYNMLSKVLKKEDIIIIPHPKVKDKMLQTPFAESIYSGLISEVLKDGKLLITDYSSICYNSFYQGAGVVFYQPDLEYYEEENGKLIPKDNEYIGYRCFDDKMIQVLINKGIKNGEIDLDFFRNESFISNYKSINEFSDGKNSQRIYQELEKRKIV